MHHLKIHAHLDFSQANTIIMLLKAFDPLCCVAVDLRLGIRAGGAKYL